MYWFALTILLISICCVPARSKELHGSVVVRDAAFQAEKPDHADESDWAAWRLRVAKEIKRQTERLIQTYGYPIAGELGVRYRVARSGDIDIVIIDDESTNLGLLVPNVIAALQHSPVLLFPNRTRKQSVDSDTVFQVSVDEELSLVSSTEPGKTNMAGREMSLQNDSLSTVGQTSKSNLLNLEEAK